MTVFYVIVVFFLKISFEVSRSDSVSYIVSLGCFITECMLLIFSPVFISLDDRNRQLGWYLGFYMKFFICSESEWRGEVGGAGFDDGTSKRQHLEMF